MNPDLLTRMESLRQNKSNEAYALLCVGIACYSVYYLSRTEMPAEDALKTFLDYVDQRLKAEGF